MSFNKVELELLYNIAKGENKIKKIQIDKSISQLYHIIKQLEKKHLLSINKGNIELSNVLYLNLLLDNLVKYPNLIDILSDSGLEILINFMQPKNVSEIIDVTLFKKSIIYRKIKQCINSSILIKDNNKYRLNKKLWQELIEFLFEYKKYHEHIDDRIPVNAKIYYKNKKEILFSSKQEINAELTAFSVFFKYGVKIYTTKQFYYLSKLKLSKKVVFLHSLLITQKEFDYRNIIYITLFYLKHKSSLRHINHEILGNIKQILNGKVIKDYPILKEIKEKAKEYDIK
jgi:hypothetical protein